jgi:hypothetical protein
MLLTSQKYRARRRCPFRGYRRCALPRPGRAACRWARRLDGLGWPLELPIEKRQKRTGLSCHVERRLRLTMEVRNDDEATCSNGLQSYWHRGNRRRALSEPSIRGGYSGGVGWGAVAGTGILGGILGSALAPQPQVIIVERPSPIYDMVPPPGIWWVRSSTPLVSRSSTPLVSKRRVDGNERIPAVRAALPWAR